MFVRFNGSNDTSIHVGDRIITINKESAEEVSSSIMDFLSGDGYHNTFRSFHLSLNFPTYYLFLKGPSYAYESGMADSSGRFSSHIFSLRSQGRSSGRVLPQKSTKILLSDSYRELSVLSSNQKVACLKVFGFGGSVSFYRKAFRLIEKEGFQTLILDLRGNSGGNLFNANQLLTYLVNDTFNLCFKRRSGKIDFDGRSDMSFSMRFSMLMFRLLKSKPKGLRPTCKKEKDILVNRFYFEPEKKNFYSGKLVVLMDGGTFSAASLVASQLRKKMKTKLLGEESGGGARGCNAMIMPTVTLPKTRMRVSIPLFQIDHELGNVPFRGLIPDYTLNSNINLKVQGIDPELEFLAKNIDLLPR
jgi:hypothetical protein